MVARDLRAQLQALNAGFVVANPSDHQAAARLASLLERTEPADMAALESNQLAGENAIFGVAAAAAASSPDGTASAALSGEPPEFRVYRREAPVATPAVPASMPDWARGAAIAETIGPLRSVDGRTFWFDFFRIVRLVPVFFAGESQPAFLFHLWERRFGLADVIDPQEIVGFLRQSRYALERGSIWVRASLFASGGPAGSYIGLTVRGGTLAFTPQVTIQNGRLTIPVGGRCAIHLDLEAPSMPVFAGGGTARDEGDALLTLPDTVAFTLSNGHGAITSLANASWTVYGQPVAFTHDAAAIPMWEPALAAVLIAYTVSVPQVDIGVVKSPWTSIAGTAPVDRAGWMLQVATIDVTNPIEAAGIGGLAVRVAAGLTIGWRGLRDGPVALPAPWIAFVPGTLFVTDANAASAQATQRLRLWQESLPPGRSTIDLRFARAGQLSYGALSIGSEVLIAHADTTAQLDRPVDVRGTPFPVHTLRSQLSLVWSEASAVVLIFDENILADALAPEADWNVAPPRSYALAIRNALFTVTPINSLAIVAVFRDEEMLERGTLRLGFGLYTVLPTLPDPYAANVRGLFFARNRQVQSVTQLLVAAVAWQKAPEDDAADTISTSFAFAPIGTQAESVAAWTIAAANRATSGMQQYVRGADVPAAPPVTADLRAFMAARSTPPDDIWDSLFQQFGQEQFSLLDVSSNADQMGVSFGFFDPRRLEKGQTPFGEAFGGGPSAPDNAVEVRDLDLSAQSRFVRAFTVPQLSWEPMLNLTAPARAGDPPQWKLLFPDDGGPTRLFNDDTAIVPIAPIPVTEHLVRTSTKRPNGFTGALFTLPFGLRAFAEFTRDEPVPESPARFEAGVQPPSFEAGAMVGGIQLRVDAPPQDPESAIFRGCTVQMDNLLNPDGTPTGTGTLGASVGDDIQRGVLPRGPTDVRNRRRAADAHRLLRLRREHVQPLGNAERRHRANQPGATSTCSSGGRPTKSIQVRSLLYPWGMHVVRTITMFRTSQRIHLPLRQRLAAGVGRPVRLPLQGVRRAVPRPRPEPRSAVPCSTPGWCVACSTCATSARRRPSRHSRTTSTKANGDTYLDQDNVEAIVDASTPAEERIARCRTATGLLRRRRRDWTTSRRCHRWSRPVEGYARVTCSSKPRGEPIPAAVLAQLLDSQFGSIGGPVDVRDRTSPAVGSGMRVSRVDVSPSIDVDGGHRSSWSRRVARLRCPTGGAGAWCSTTQGTGEVTPLDPQVRRCRLIRRGLLLNPATARHRCVADDLVRLANPVDLVRAPTSATRNFGLLQSTGTQKALFRLPSFQQGVDSLLSARARLRRRLPASSTPTADLPQRAPTPCRWCWARSRRRSSTRATSSSTPRKPDKVLRAGAAAGAAVPDQRVVPEALRRVRGQPTRTAHPLGDGSLRFGLDSAGGRRGRSGCRRSTDIGMVVDLGSMKRVMTHGAASTPPTARQPGFRRARARVQRRAATGDRHPPGPARAPGRRLRRRHEEGPRRRDEQQRRQLELRLPRPPGDPGRASSRRSRSTVRRPSTRSSSKRTSRSACTSTRRCRSPTTDIKQSVAVRGRVSRVRRQPVGDVREPRRGHGVRHGSVDLITAADIKTGPVAAHEVRVRRRDRRRTAGGRRRVGDLHGRRA